ncbi:HD domain-containing protein [Variovorax sp. EBFNA2]|uniref:HD domain-containing protein n=1 Tax=Variovorax sp. EBFNA2 TaxID=3342097 RepID=UPI0029C0CD7F|nr:HD domain-containing protein [Variovorax boronicumulans]WPG36739.1 hypothetical protein RZE79_25130 [Variovorax boronicumulans]
MTWMLTASGAEYHLAGPTSLAACGRPVKIEDVAHHLAIVAQFNGATSRPYSVAEHSLLCADIARRAGASVFVEMAALMHDAHEAYTNDLISPAKLAVNSFSMGAGGVAAWGLFEAEHAKTVREHFKLLSVFAGHRTLLRSIDSQALATARRDLTPFNPARHLPWAVLGDDTVQPVAPADWVRLDTPEREAATWKDWREQFRSRFLELQVQRTLAGLATTNTDTALRHSLSLPASKEPS